MLLQPDRPALCDETEALLLCADRAQHARQVIRPALERRKLVISDRYSDSTLAYQGYGDGLDLDTLRLITRFATSDLVPDLTILLDIDVETGLERKRAALFAGEGEYNRIDDRQVDYHRRVRAGFRQLVDEEPGRFFVLNGESPPHMLAERIWEKVVSTLGLPGERFEAGRDERVT